MQIGPETPEYRKSTSPPEPTQAGACEHITIPVAEYVYLQRVDALMDPLLLADNFNNAQVLASVKNAVKAMRNPGKGGADQ